MQKTKRAASKQASTESAKAALKTFKQSDEVQDFYRFVHENNLRRDAKTMIETLVAKVKATSKKKGRRKKTVH